MRQRKELAMRFVFLFVIERGIGLKKRKLLIARALCIGGGYKLFQPEAFKVGSKVFREIRPLRIVAGKQNGFSSKNVGIVLNLGVHFGLNIGVLRIKLVVFGVFCRSETCVSAHFSTSF